MNNKLFTIATQSGRVLAKFSPSGQPLDGVNFLAAALGHKHRTGVRYWLECGSIPIPHWETILIVSFQFVAMNDFGKLVHPRDFIAHLSGHNLIRETWPDLLDAA